MVLEQSTISYNPTRSIYDISDGFGTGAFDNVIICVPRIGWLVARSFLLDYGKRRINYGKSYSVLGYKAPNDEDMDTIDAFVSETAMADMTCVNDIVDAIDRISAVLSGDGCCGNGANGGEQTDSEPNPFESDGNNFPPDFDSVAEFDTWKCKRANIIVSSWQSDISFLQTTPVAQYGIALFVASFLTPTPVDNILIAIGTLTTWILEGLIDGYLAEISLFLSLNEDDLVCDLYSASTAEAARGDVLSRLGNMSLPAASFVAFLVTFTSVNTLFVENQVYGSLPNTVQSDCTGCEEPTLCGLVVTNGTTQNGIQYNGTFDGLNYTVSMVLNVDSGSLGDTCDDRCSENDAVVNASNLVGWTLRNGGPGSMQLNRTLPIGNPPCVAGVYSGEVLWPDGIPIRTLQIFSSTPFSVQLDGLI